MRMVMGKPILSALGCFLVVTSLALVPADAKILVVSPHPDDDVISAGGVTYNALKNAESIKIVFMTNGDAGIDPPGTAAGLLRQAEAVDGQAILGGREDDLIFLGYPDGNLQKIYNNYPNANSALTTPWGQSVTYGNRGLGRKDYHYYRFGAHAPYNSYNILLDLADVLSTYRPDHIFVTSEYDGHPDHVATYQFVKAAVIRVHGSDPTYMPAIHKTIIWWGEGDSWPNPLDVTQNFAEINDLSAVTRLSWSDRESIQVPLPLQSPNISVNPKYQAQAAHVSQAGLLPLGFLTRFVHKDEIFWVDDLPGFSLPPSSEAGPDQIVGVGGVVRLDGSGSVSRGAGALSFQWRQISGKLVSLSNSQSATPSFYAPTDITSDEILAFQLVVTSGGLSSVPDVTKVTVRPSGVPSFALSVSGEGTGTGGVLSSPGGIDCGDTCSASFLSGTIVSLTAIPDPGSTFSGWGGACTGTGSCTIALSDASSVRANFSAGGLVAAFGFDEGSGASTADASGNGLSGMITGGNWNSAGKNGTSLSFNGLTTWVTLPDSDLLDLSRGMTLEAWVSPAASPTGWKSIIMKEALTTYVYGLYLSPVGNPAVYLVINGQEQGFELNSPLPLNIWTHLAVTFDGATLSMYVNGVVAASQPLNAAIPASSGVLRIGGNSIWKSEYFLGKIDDVRIYNRALSAIELVRDVNTMVSAVPEQGTLRDFSVNPSSVVGGTAANATVTLTAPAPVGGALVTIASDSSSTSVPPAVTVPAGYDSATFAVNTVASASSLTSILTSSYNGTSKTAALTVIPPPPSVTLTVAKTGSGAGTVTSAPPGLDCGPVCNSGYVSGTQLALSAVPAPGYGFGGWSGACSGTGKCTLILTSPQSVTAEFTSGRPVAAFAFDEGTGTTAGDASGNSHNGIITAGSWTASGKNGAAVVFNGSSSWVTVPDSNLLDLSTSMTLEAWIYPTATSTNWWTIMMKESPGFYVYSLYLAPSSHPAVYLVIGGQEQGVEVPAATLPVNAWSHLAATYDGTTLRLYLNGTQIGSKSVSAVVPASTGVLRIGGNGIWGKEFFKGRIDDVRIYNRALSVTEIQNDMSIGVK